MAPRRGNPGRSWRGGKDTFNAAERLARERRLTRSELYSRALETLLKLRREQELREQVAAAVLAAPTAHDTDRPFPRAGTAALGALLEQGDEPW